MVGPVEIDAHSGRCGKLAAILTGGRARRMGSDKSALLLNGESLLARVHARLSAVAGRIVAVGGAPQPEGRDIEVIPDRYPGADSLGGIATALGFVSEGAGCPDWVLVVACDMPFVEPSLLRQLFRLRRGYDIVVPRTEAGYEPLCALYRTTCLPVIESQLATGNLRIRDVFRQVRTREVPTPECRKLDPELLSFVNVNRPADLQRAEEILCGEQGGRAG